MVDYYDHKNPIRIDGVIHRTTRPAHLRLVLGRVHPGELTSELIDAGAQGFVPCSGSLPSDGGALTSFGQPDAHDPFRSPSATVRFFNRIVMSRLLAFVDDPLKAALVAAVIATIVGLIAGRAIG